MVQKIFGIFAGMGLLIAIYLFVKNPNGTTGLINSLGSNTVKGIAALQGREITPSK
jgi:hypothetical protein